jgi:hypothetical protein
MKKLVTIVALATAVIAAPAFAKSDGGKSERRAAQSFQQNEVIPSSNLYGGAYGE